MQMARRSVCCEANYAVFRIIGSEIALLLPSVQSPRSIPFRPFLLNCLQTQILSPVPKWFSAFANYKHECFHQFQNGSGNVKHRLKLTALLDYLVEAVLA